MEDGSTGARSELDAEVAADLETEIDVTIVTLRFDASDDAGLLAVLSKYIVLARMEDGCRNIDLVSSVTKPGRHLVIEKWESPDHQRRHFDSELMVEMATACTGILAAPPEIDLWEATSAHDLA
jgi:quinol monooxygenase YgiN